ncbi:MAG: DUF4124 domain-containing protein, partial [Halioglobus sp.]
MSIAGAKLYTWKNQAGESVFSDRPPVSGIAYEVVDAVSGSRRAPSAGDETSESGSVEASKNIDPILCEKAQMNLIALQSESTVVVRGDDGASRELTGAEREIAKQTAQAQI